MKELTNIQSTVFAADLVVCDLLHLCYRGVWSWCYGLFIEMLLREGSPCFFDTAVLTLMLFLYFFLALPVLNSLLFLLFWIKKTTNGCKAASKLLYQCFSLALLQQRQKGKHLL